METGPPRPAASCPRTSAGQGGGVRAAVRPGQGSGAEVSAGSQGTGDPARWSLVGGVGASVARGKRTRNSQRSPTRGVGLLGRPAPAFTGPPPTCSPPRRGRHLWPRERACACVGLRACVRARARGGGPESGAAAWGGSAEAAPPRSRSRSRSRGPRLAPAPGPPAQAAPRARRCRPCRRGTGCGAWRSSSRTSATVSGGEPDPACVGWGRRPG